MGILTCEEVPVGIIRTFDEELHYSDGSHRWSSPYGADGDDAWRARVESHVEEHRRSMGAPPASRSGRCHVPSARRAVAETAG